jgi:hypothetical protein
MSELHNLQILDLEENDFKDEKYKQQLQSPAENLQDFLITLKSTVAFQALHTAPSTIQFLC